MLGKMPGHARNGAEPWLARLIYASVEAPEIIRVESVAFGPDEAIPPLFTAEGEGESPPLRWRGAPDGSAAIVIVVEDPDAPGKEPFIHALAVKTPGGDDDLIPGALARPGAAEQEGMSLGLNSRGEAGWTPPAPPRGDGLHRYVFQVYAVDEILVFDTPPGKREILEALRGHAIAKGCVTGLFERIA